MTKDKSKEGKVPNQPTKPSKEKGRGFCCSIFIYTFVFVSGVVAATILPDLAGHHFKQPYGKEYGALAEQIVKDLPKHLTTFSETVVLLGRDLLDRVWAVKAKAEERFTEKTNKKPEKTQTKSNSHSSGRAHGSN